MVLFPAAGGPWIIICGTKIYNFIGTCTHTCKSQKCISQKKDWTNYLALGHFPWTSLCLVYSVNQILSCPVPQHPSIRNKPNDCLWSRLLLTITKSSISQGQPMPGRFSSLSGQKDNFHKRIVTSNIAMTKFHAC